MTDGETEHRAAASEPDDDNAPEPASDSEDGNPPDPAAGPVEHQPPDRDPERRAKQTPADPEDRPGPLNPGEEDRVLPTGVESYERPGRDGNWAPHSRD